VRELASVVGKMIAMVTAIPVAQAGCPYQAAARNGAASPGEQELHQCWKELLAVWKFLTALMKKIFARCLVLEISVCHRAHSPLQEVLCSWPASCRAVPLGCLQQAVMAFLEAEVVGVLVVPDWANQAWHLYLLWCWQLEGR
jgi:hypothetical protein